jgi:hypothetical protein
LTGRQQIGYLVSKEKTVIYLIVLGWLLCGFLSYGCMLGSQSAQYGEFGSRFAQALCSILLEPIGLFATALTYGTSNFRLKPLSKEESWKIHQKKYPSMDYEEFERTYHG